MKKVVVVLPTYNEKRNLEKFIGEVFKQENELPGFKIEVLIVDSSSPDGTGELAQKLAAKNPKIHFLNVGRGLGVALVQGHQYSLSHLKPDILAQLDADGQVEADVLVRLVKAVDEGFDLALGSRFVEGGKNKLSPSRQLFSAGSSWICRIIMGPINIKEFTNSARAFTPALFKKINLNRLPWHEQSFIIQPAFLNEAILTGAKYKEVPLVFKNRAEGYSKNKVVQYMYDVITYAIDARLHKWGINFDFYHYTRRARTFLKFGTVGLTGTLVDFGFYNIFINFFSIAPATAKGFSTEIAIINNFTLNNVWTFKYRKTTTKLWQKFIIFNIVSLGGLAIAVTMIKLLHMLYGDGFWHLGPISIPFYNLYFFATIPPVMIWNFVVNHLVTWRNHPEQDTH
ncbi:glycosyltransferase [Patescibacteria group bacterium]|nr:glycosyltransferase [Patescibacteria group bacterium]MCL5409631.1 glycosyltransferase [Patescibacteria group bacterium]